MFCAKHQGLSLHKNPRGKLIQLRYPRLVGDIIDDTHCETATFVAYDPPDPSEEVPVWRSCVPEFSHNFFDTVLLTRFPQFFLLRSTLSFPESVKERPPFSRIIREKGRRRRRCIATIFSRRPDLQVKLHSLMGWLESQPLVETQRFSARLVRRELHQVAPVLSSPAHCLLHQCLAHAVPSSVGRDAHPSMSARLRPIYVRLGIMVSCRNPTTTPSLSTTTSSLAGSESIVAKAS